MWNDFADWYIEAAKARLYGGDAQAAVDAVTDLVRRDFDEAADGH